MKIFDFKKYLDSHNNPIIKFFRNIFDPLKVLNIQVQWEDSKTMKARKEAHKFFDQLWMRKIMSRNAAYTWLASKLNIEKRDCHISLFDIETCRKVVDFSIARLNAELVDRCFDYLF